MSVIFSLSVTFHNTFHIHFILRFIQIFFTIYFLFHFYVNRFEKTCSLSIFNIKNLT